MKRLNDEHSISDAYNEILTEGMLGGIGLGAAGGMMMGGPLGAATGGTIGGVMTSEEEPVAPEVPEGEEEPLNEAEGQIKGYIEKTLYEEMERNGIPRELQEKIANLVERALRAGQVDEGALGSLCGGN